MKHANPFTLADVMEIRRYDPATLHKHRNASHLVITQRPGASPRPRILSAGDKFELLYRWGSSGARIVPNPIAGLVLVYRVDRFETGQVLAKYFELERLREHLLITADDVDELPTRSLVVNVTGYTQAAESSTIERKLKLRLGKREVEILRLDVSVAELRVA